MINPGVFGIPVNMRVPPDHVPSDAVVGTRNRAVSVCGVRLLSLVPYNRAAV